MFEACPQDAVSVGWMFLLLCAWVVSEKILKPSIHYRPNIVVLICLFTNIHAIFCFLLDMAALIQ